MNSSSTSHKKKRPPTKRQLVDKMKVKHYNQMRNLFVKQFKELSEFYSTYDQPKKPNHTPTA